MPLILPATFRQQHSAAETHTSTRLSTLETPRQSYAAICKHICIGKAKERWRPPLCSRPPTSGVPRTFNCDVQTTWQSWMPAPMYRVSRRAGLAVHHDGGRGARLRGRRHAVAAHGCQRRQNCRQQNQPRQLCPPELWRLRRHCNRHYPCAASRCAFCAWLRTRRQNRMLMCMMCCAMMS